MTRLILLAVTLLLSACATVDSTRVPVSNSSAIITGQMDRYGGTFTWRSFVPLSIDSVPVSHSFWGDPNDTQVAVEPGVHRITLRAAFNNGIGGGGPWETIVVLQASIEAGRTYRLNGRVVDDTFVVWLEDPTTGKRQPEEGIGKWAPIAQQHTIPVFIPVAR